MVAYAHAKKWGWFISQTLRYTKSAPARATFLTQVCKCVWAYDLYYWHKKLSQKVNLVYYVLLTASLGMT